MGGGVGNANTSALTAYADNYGTAAADAALTTTATEAINAEMAAMPVGQGGIFVPFSTVTMGQISDGTSNTYLCGEKYVDAMHYTDGYFDDYTVIYCGCDPVTIREVCFADLNPIGYGPRQDTAGYTNQSIFGSAHAGMCNMAFCDGSVHQISYGIAPHIHYQLGNRADGQAIDASMY